MSRNLRTGRFCAAKDEDKGITGAKLLEGSVDYDKWIDTSLFEEAYKDADANP